MSLSFIDIGLGFIEGFALIVSPCILPVLPLVLSTSLSGGRARPYGIILGFIFSFVMFAWFSRWAVTAFGIDLDTIKYGSLILLAAFGLILMSETLSARFSALTQGAADFGARLSGGGEGGFASGIGIGALIGLVWTPCAGPFLAAVLVQVIRQETDFQGLLVLLAFSIGAGVPMLAIALLGRRFVGSLGFFQRHAEGVRKTFGALILAAVVFLASGVDALTLFQTDKPKVETIMSQAQSPTTLKNPLAAPFPAPEIDSSGQWFNSAPLTLAALKGKVVLIDFWTYSCINCVRTMPFITAWDARYRDKGLVIIGVHAPEFAFEKDPANVAKAIQKFGIHYPVVQDNDFVSWRRYNNRYWPAHYLIDREGKVVYTHFGEGHYETTEHNIRVLLGESGEAAPMPGAAATPFAMNQTPETYMGAARAERFMSSPDFTSGTGQSFAFPIKRLEADEWALSGKWDVDQEKITSAEAGAKLQLSFRARKVFLVMGSKTGTPIEAIIRLNETPVGQGKAGKDVQGGKLTVAGPTLFELIDLGSYGSGTLEIEAKAPGLEAYAFTFGN